MSQKDCRCCVYSLSIPVRLLCRAVDLGSAAIDLGHWSSFSIASALALVSPFEVGVDLLGVIAGNGNVVDVMASRMSKLQ